MADIVNRNTHLDITVEASAGTETVLEGVATRLMDLGGPLGGGGVVAFYVGAKQYEGKAFKDLRGIVGMGVMDINFIASPDSGIKTMSDLKGHKVATYPGASYVFYDPLIESYGLKPGVDYEEVFMEGDEIGWDEMIVGRVDAIPTYGATNLLPIQEALGSVVFLPLDPENWKKVKATNPDVTLGIVSGKLTKEYYDSIGLDVPEPVDILVSPRLLLTTKSLSDDVAYTIAKTMVERYKEFQQVVAPEYSPDLAVWAPEVPFHKGAIRAFQEMGMWTDEMEKAQIRLLAQE